MNNPPEKPDPENAKDGFDLIEYPCDYAFKAMCRADPGESALAHIKGLVVQMVDLESVLEIRDNQSRTGKFESVTATVRIRDREQLESIYKLIAASSRVVMTL